MCRPPLQGGGRNEDARSQSGPTRVVEGRTRTPACRAGLESCAMSNEKPRRLRRLSVTFAERPMFFLTLCAHNRRIILANPHAHDMFLTFCQSSAEKAGVEVGRYVLMPDHLHVFVCAEDSRFVSHWVGSLKKFMAKGWRLAGMAGPFWEKGFFDHVLRSGESYSQKGEYVRDNPVRSGLVKEIQAWLYCGEVANLRW